MNSIIKEYLELRKEKSNCGAGHFGTTEEIKKAEDLDQKEEQFFKVHKITFKTDWTCTLIFSNGVLLGDLNKESL